MAFNAEKRSVSVVPREDVSSPVNVHRDAVFVAYPPEWTPQEVEAVVRAARGIASPSPTSN